MGTAWRTGLPGVFIGNTAESVPGQAAWSVLAVEREGVVSRVTRAAG
jgi:nucleotide-binding universal stress UspA family protein